MHTYKYGRSAHLFMWIEGPPLPHKTVNGKKSQYRESKDEGFRHWSFISFYIQKCLKYLNI